MKSYRLEERLNIAQFQLIYVAFVSGVILEPRGLLVDFWFIQGAHWTSGGVLGDFW